MLSEEVERGGGGEPHTSARPVQERHFWRIGSIMAVVFLQIMTSEGLDQLVHKDIEFFGIDHHHLNDLTPVLFGSVIIAYAMLVWIGLYTDTVVGKYKMMVFGAALKMSGTCIMFAVVLIMKFASDLSMVSVKVSLVAGIVGIVFFGAGSIVFWSSFITFGLEQVERPAAATTVRWGFWTATLALFISGELIEYVVHETSVWLVSRHAFLLIVDVLSITVLLLCKTKYTITTFEQGRKSLKGLVRAVTTIAFCRRRSDATVRILQTREERCRDRFLFKKVLFLIALLSVMVIAQSMAYVLQQICIAHRSYCFHDPVGLADFIPATQRIVAIILIPAFELLGKKLRCQGCLLWQDSAKNQLKMFGIGSLLASLALVMAGAVATAVRQRGGSENVSPVWAFPQFVTLGVAQVILCTSMVVFCLFESLPGLTTTTATVAFSLFFLGPAVELVVGTIQKDFDEAFPRGDIVLYSVGGAMVVTLVIIYLPLAMAYLKAKSELEALDIETGEQDDLYVSGEDVQPEGQTLSRLVTQSTIMSESPTRNYGSLEDFSSAGSINKDNLGEIFGDE